MIEKLVCFEELKLEDMSFNGKELNKMIKDLEMVGFFSEDKTHKNCQKIFTILKKVPNNLDKFKGQQYIREDYIENNKYVKAKIYDFNLKVIQDCS
jgi:hypothetical protein